MTKHKIKTDFSKPYHAMPHDRQKTEAPWKKILSGRHLPLLYGILFLPSWRLPVCLLSTKHFSAYRNRTYS